MRITIDNLDGRGAVDYSGAIAADGPLTIERVLNAPSRCVGMLDVDDLAVPVRRGRVVVTASDGTVLFTGYLVTEPEAVYAGAGLAGPVYRVRFAAVSDEWLLDKQPPVLAGTSLADSGSSLLNTLAQRAGAGLLAPASAADTKQVGMFSPEATAAWSANAGNAAAAAYAAYRVLDGAVSLSPIGALTHALNFDEAPTQAEPGWGTLLPAQLQTAMVKELANDVTLSGEIEPGAYVSEMFIGDGTTAAFQLAEQTFHVTHSTLLHDVFELGTINTQLWTVTDPGSHLSLGTGGLTLSGGTGFDGQTILTAIDPVEMGGSLVVEAANVQFGTGSDGVLCGLYAGPVLRANCFAGYNVRQSGGSTMLTPLVNGVEVGTTCTLLEGHRYTIRIRLHSPEMQRVLQTYCARVDGAVETFGGGLVDSAMALVFELRDMGDASNTPATVLYDGAAARSPASCTFAAVNSVALNGSLGSCTVRQGGSAWVVSTPPDGQKQTRLIGVAGEGVDCQISGTGMVTFFAGRVPEAGEIVTILYRMRNRSIARLQDTASVAAEAAGGMPGTARWLGRVVRPKARCSADCEAAAQAVLRLATSRVAAIAGKYVAINPAEDVWPGDVLSITANGKGMNVVVRAVTIADGHAEPEWLTYRIAFANDWAECLGITLSEAIAADAVLPGTALDVPTAALANLSGMCVMSATATSITVNAGCDPPAGGGFEVRRRDWNFGPGTDADLVLRSPVRTFAVPRTAQLERYYVRMYDGSTPPVYSRLSSAVFTNLPVGE